MHKTLSIMSNNLALKKGLNVPLDGAAAPEVIKRITPDVVAVKPTDFKGFLPRLLVKEGDAVLAGSPVMAHKQNPEILLTSPVSGTVVEVNEALADNPELVNEDAYANWIIKVKLSDKSELDNLMDAAAYTELCAE